MLRLSRKWIQHLQSHAETGMGYHVAAITLIDGRVFPQAVVDSGQLTRIRGLKQIPFSEDAIAAIRVTHEKWDWKDEADS
jgi:hypothetical protein